MGTRRPATVLATVAALWLTGVTGPPAATGATPAGTSTYRLAGPGRYDTAVRVSQQWFPAAGPAFPDTIYLANGEQYADALSVAPVAALHHAPLLLIPRDTIPAVVAGEITRLGARNITITGGPAAISEAVAAQLASRGLKVTRIAGTDRYDTSRRVAEHGIALGVFGTHTANVFVVTGRDHADALAAGAAAGLADVAAPVLLTDGQARELSTAAAAVLAKLPASATVTVVGGPAAVTDQVLASIPNPGTKRISGVNRYETSQAVVATFTRTHAWDQGFLAAGTGSVDALAGAAYAGATGAPLWIIPGNCVPPPVADAVAQRQLAGLGLLGGADTLTPAVDSLTPCEAPRQTPHTAAPEPEPTPTAAAPAPAGVNTNAATLAAEVVWLTNQHRAAAGCPELRVDARLTRAAQLHSEDMAANGYFDHTSLDGRSPRDRIKAQGYFGSAYGENIAVGFASSPAEVLAGWMNSPGHRANILNCQYDAIGAGWAQDYWTQSFGAN